MAFNLPGFFADYVKKTYPNTIVKSYCKTCKKVFLKDMFLLDFVQKSNAFNLGKMHVMDEWFNLAHEHWKANPKHKIIFKCPPMKSDTPLGPMVLPIFPNDLTEFFEIGDKRGQI
jgi:hypothetical protein